MERERLAKKVRIAEQVTKDKSVGATGAGDPGRPAGARNKAAGKVNTSSYSSLGGSADLIITFK